MDHIDHDDSGYINNIQLPRYRNYDIQHVFKDSHFSVMLLYEYFPVLLALNFRNRSFVFYMYNVKNVKNYQE